MSRPVLPHPAEGHRVTVAPQGGFDATTYRSGTVERVLFSSLIVAFDEADPDGREVDQFYLGAVRELDGIDVTLNDYELAA